MPWRTSTRCWHCLVCTLFSTTLAMVSAMKGKPTLFRLMLFPHCTAIILVLHWTADEREIVKSTYGPRLLQDQVKIADCVCRTMQGARVDQVIKT